MSKGEYTYSANIAFEESSNWSRIIHNGIQKVDCEEIESILHQQLKKTKLTVKSSEADEEMKINDTIYHTVYIRLTEVNSHNWNQKVFDSIIEWINKQRSAAGSNFNAFGVFTPESNNPITDEGAAILDSRNNNPTAEFTARSMPVKLDFDSDGSVTSDADSSNP
ncbi:hypothetical protein COEREDRAFT_87517 [Coemansia reversa NRRL 1564]|uniref:Uncharacterized protein n=1 Tax=Coemansia reversa (strain ATCC 12441 / NRRL 1564) TaxID=763665 RepID=A0A2G5BAM6_COERN|nr:hypothetical protein COEREDRAFT_87517 [Coemansia reversa NRRL 1564]|eukprot:PIA15767.1 hypothetical protein COEREDRAFT_87517 [Coemansia reversa NRRL 1564]